MLCKALSVGHCPLQVTALLHYVLCVLSISHFLFHCFVHNISLTSSKITVTWLTLLHQNLWLKWTWDVWACVASCGSYVWTNWLLLSLNATICSLWDISPGNPVSGSVVVVVVDWWTVCLVRCRKFVFINIFPWHIC